MDKIACMGPTLIKLADECKQRSFLNGMIRMRRLWYRKMSHSMARRGERGHARLQI